MQTACTFKEWRAITKRAVEQAKAGDATARKWLSDYLIGPPPQSVDIKQTGQVTINVKYSDESHRQP